VKGVVIAGITPSKGWVVVIGGSRVVRGVFVVVGSVVGRRLAVVRSIVGRAAVGSRSWIDSIVGRSGDIGRLPNDVEDVAVGDIGGRP
jgi:hypothetical protein